ncbi:MAG: hypothetical protein ACI3YC_00610 [Alloprevotella sp.]
MNIYVRYFDIDALVKDADELIQFLSSIPDIPLNDALVQDIRDYVSSDMPYPKRYKIRPRIYFILIKTAAETMEEFKTNKKSTIIPAGERSNSDTPAGRKEIKLALLAEQKEGWYLCRMTFKRVIPIMQTGKFRYTDTEFIAYVKGQSGMDCYQRIISHLKSRQEIDLRSQFPSAKGSNFFFEFQGAELPVQVQ